MVQLTLKFSGTSKEVLESKIQPAIEQYDLKANYFDGAVDIIGPLEVIQEIKSAYEQQQMIHRLFRKSGIRFN